MVKNIAFILFTLTIFNGCSIYHLVYDNEPEYRQLYYSEEIYNYINKKKYFESKAITEYLEEHKNDYKKPLKEYMDYTKQNIKNNVW